MLLFQTLSLSESIYAQIKHKALAILFGGKKTPLIVPTRSYHIQDHKPLLATFRQKSATLL